MKIDFKEKLYKIVHKSFVILLYLIIILVFILIYTSKGKSIKTSNYESFIIISESMKPEIEIGDIIIIKRVAEEQIKIDDIITFEKNGEYITHRVKNITEENEKVLYTTKGDNNSVADTDKICYSRIKGVKVAVIPFIGLIIIAVSKQKNIILILLFVLLLYRRARKKDNKKMERIKKKRIEDEKIAKRD